MKFIHRIFFIYIFKLHLFFTKCCRKVQYSVFFTCIPQWCARCCIANESHNGPFRAQQNRRAKSNSRLFQLFLFEAFVQKFINITFNNILFRFLKNILLFIWFLITRAICYKLTYGLEECTVSLDLGRINLCLCSHIKYDRFVFLRGFNLYIPPSWRRLWNMYSCFII